MIELLFLLLPVAAAYGYVMGKNSAKNQALLVNRKITSQYNKGLKFLLEREEAQGLEHLIEILEVSAESVEHYLTLASLFRKRGELDRAIKTHEILLNHPSLSGKDADICRLALAKDYILAGLFDSAEEHLVILIKKNNKNAVDLIIQLYSQMSDWRKGVSMYEAYSHLFTKKHHCSAIASFYCETAKLDTDPQLMEKASALKFKTIRPTYELGLEAYSNEDYVKAIYYWRDLICNFTITAPLYIDKLEHSYKNLNLLNQFNQLIKDILPNGGVLIRMKYCLILITDGKSQEAIKYLSDSLKREPSIRGFSYLLELISKNDDSLDQRFIEINKLVTQYIATKPEYQCQHCGFSSHSLYWLCPSCKHWESIVPAQGIDGF